MTSAGRFGYGTFVLALLSGGLALTTIVAAASIFVWVPYFATHPDDVAAGVGAAVALAAAAFLVAGSGVMRVRRVPKGAPGKGRLGTLFGMTAIGASTTSIALIPVIIGAGQASTGFVLTLTPDDLLLKLPRAAQIALVAVAGNGLFDCVVALIALALSFSLLPARVRSVTFVTFDVAVIVGAIAGILLLPSEPETNDLSDLAGPVTRLALIAVAILRVSLRLLPAVMSGVERMGFLSLVASRHLRSRKSSFLAAIGSLSILAVALSSCMLTTVLSVMGGFRADLQSKILGSHAHIVIDREGGGRIEGWQDTLDTARATEGVSAATPVASGEVMVTSASNLSGAVVRGIDTATISDVSDLERNLVRGQLSYLTHPERLLNLSAEDRDYLGRTPSPSVAPTNDSDIGPGVDRFAAEDEGEDEERDVLPGVILGRELAKTLRVVVGDDIEVVSPLGELGPTGLMPKTRAFRVAGIFFSGMYEYDMKHVYMTLPVAQRFLNMGDAITGVEISVRDVERAPAVARALDQRIGRGDLRVRDWQELNKNLFGALALEKLAMFVTLGIAVLIAGFCVFGTLTLMVQEKGREVGILKAMGTTSRAIIGIFLIEGLLIGLFGATLGLGLGFLAAFAAEHFGIRMNPEVYYIDRLPVSISAAEFGLVGVSAVLICLLATIFPAYLASSTRPVDALRYD